MDGVFGEAGGAALDDGPAPPFDDGEIARTVDAAPHYCVELVGLGGRS